MYSTRKYVNRANCFCEGIPIVLWVSWIQCSGGYFSCISKKIKFVQEWKSDFEFKILHLGFAVVWLIPLYFVATSCWQFFVPFRPLLALCLWKHLGVFQCADGGDWGTYLISCIISDKSTCQFLFIINFHSREKNGQPRDVGAL